ncbi:uncharacterized protein SOCEGT47_001680 [Sorangium cellulosum]|uniref:Uncharacterized protein n=1 Tax=Sorangium cellulosum TaxID=56 RepID=A0A4P2PTJ5_SORCE|nr:hypothetical protein [Sorangium cellulosum]AUX19716.1 uncharacterized protein SOCEGT47_001680 [Sorangium cellulosum]
MANHDDRNSEWQIADANSGGIQGRIDHEPLFDPLEHGSPAQHETGRLAAVQFFIDDRSTRCYRAAC